MEEVYEDNPAAAAANTGSHCVLNVLYGLKVFDMVYALTNGGPGHTTEVMYTAVFKQFSQGMYAVGTTISSIMFVVLW